MPISLGFGNGHAHITVTPLRLEYGTEPILFVTLHFRDRRGAALPPLQKSRRSQCSYEAVCGIVSVPTQELTGMVCTLLKISVRVRRAFPHSRAP